MNIGEAAEASGLPAKTIRYYEQIGLLVAPRAANAYRSYGEREVHKLRFVARARGLGFSIEECRSLLSLYEDEQRASADVKQLAEQHMRELDQKIAELQGLRDTLATLIGCCHGDDRPDCPILADLAGGPGKR
jgi:Cu(I)-responsive transcriptional regulator